MHDALLSHDQESLHEWACRVRLPPPMGLGRKATGADLLHFVFALDIPLVDGKVGPACWACLWGAEGACNVAPRL